MRNKICSNCNCVNGERGTYCRKCGISLEGILPVEAPEGVKSGPALSSGSRSSGKSLVGPDKSREPDIKLPDRPERPGVIYWPFVLSMICAFLMLALIFVFFMFGQKEDSGIETVNTTFASTPSSETSQETSGTATSPAPTPAPVDISNAEIGNVEDQLYSGEAITIAYSLSYEGEELVEGRDYEVIYEDNIGIGTATAYFNATGDNYTGSFSTSFNIISGDGICDDPDNSGVVSMVMRLYSGMLGRYPSLDELIQDAGRLRNGEITGSELVNEVIFGEECEARNLPDTDFVSCFYLAVLGRDPDASGLDYNVALLSDGMTREELVNGIISAPGGEFEIICSDSGVSL